MNRIIAFLLTLVFFTNTLFSQKKNLPDTIYVAVFGSTVLIADLEYNSPRVNLITTNFIFTKKKPEVVYFEYAEQGEVEIYWSHSRQIVDGDDAWLVYSSDIISEESVKKRKGRIFAQLGNNYHIYYTKEKPNSKRFQRSMDRLLKKLNKREKTKS